MWRGAGYGGRVSISGGMTRCREREERGSKSWVRDRQVEGEKKINNRLTVVWLSQISKGKRYWCWCLYCAVRYDIGLFTAWRAWYGEITG